MFPIQGKSLAVTHEEKNKHPALGGHGDGRGAQAHPANGVLNEGLGL